MGRHMLGHSSPVLVSILEKEETNSLDVKSNGQGNLEVLMLGLILYDSF